MEFYITGVHAYVVPSFMYLVNVILLPENLNEIGQAVGRRITSVVKKNCMWNEKYDANMYNYVFSSNFQYETGFHL